LVAVAAAFCLLAGLVSFRWGPLARADVGIDDTVHRFMLGHRAAVTAARVFTDIGRSAGWAVLLAPIVIWLCVRRRWADAAFVVATAVGSDLVNNVAKVLFHRARPELLQPLATGLGESFPSGHAQFAAVGAALVVTTLGRAWLLPATLLAAAIGTSRIALGVHYLSDVLGGYLLGVVCFLVADGLRTLTGTSQVASSRGKVR
jgi:undecaprenyl-diphosphatase